MRIALDFDETFTLHPEFWARFVRETEREGHYVAIVTARDEHHDGINWSSVGLGAAPCRVIWCDGLPKKEFCASIGEKFDVWIDDNPHGILHGTTMKSREHLKAWRLTDKHRGSNLEAHGNSKGFDHISYTEKKS